MIKYDTNNSVFKMLACYIQYKKYLGESFSHDFELYLYCTFINNNDMKTSNRPMRIHSLDNCVKRRERTIFDGDKISKEIIDISFIEKYEKYIDAYCYFCQIKELRNSLTNSIQDAFLAVSDSEFVEYVDAFEMNYNQNDYFFVQHNMYDNINRWNKESWNEYSPNLMLSEKAFYLIKHFNLFMMGYDETVYFDDKSNSIFPGNTFFIILALIKSLLVLNAENDAFSFEDNVRNIVEELYFHRIYKYPNEYKYLKINERFEKEKEYEEKTANLIIEQLNREEYKIIDFVAKSSCKCGYLLYDYVEKNNLYNNVLITNLVQGVEKKSRIKRVLIDLLWSLIIKREFLNVSDYLSERNIEIRVGTSPFFKALIDFVCEITFD